MSHAIYARPKPRSTQPVPHTAYQVDYVAVNCGKIVAASKRRIRFKFGYTNLESISNGITGQECRGSEHEVAVTWSLSSGKQAISFDQHEVYFDVGDSTQTKISHSFKDQLGHTIEVKVHAASMSSKANPDPDWKQYDLIVDGVSYFRMPKIFQIGIVPKDEPAQGSYRVAPKFAQYNSNRASPTQGAGQFRNGANNNMESILPPEEPKKAEPKPVEVTDLLSFDEFDALPAAAPAVAALPQAAAVQSNNSAPVFAQAPAQAVPAFAQAPAAPVPAQYQQNYAAQENPYSAPANPFGNPQAQDQGFANIVSPTTSPGLAQAPSVYAALAPTANPAAAPTSYAAPAPTIQTYNESSYSAPTPGVSYAQQPTPVTPPSSTTVLNPAEPAPTAYGADTAIKNLVNIDDLFGTSAAAPATKKSVDAKMQEVNAHKSLGQLHGSANMNNGAKQPVMNPFNTAPPAYQQQQQQQQQQQCMHSGYGAQHPINFSQQPYAQPGFGYQ